MSNIYKILLNSTKSVSVRALQRTCLTLAASCDILRKCNYPPDQQEAVASRVLEQAELISEELAK